ncbi:PTS sugar transporter subunit IIB [Vibrio sp. SCSIO 43140]|uniref:PTS sugar transporter subunit IIB n=1 Tax=Vibrio sp. SCSIO 43140 TaxID=2819100 RepID=UPI00207653EB|nr:PTS sugar transporter subunit IIB [Vibrio sp. SCSIO 43140]USD61368.1 PTS sugar transporter subunit IIB [Vibrio sp. SCSIO 43140]
MSYNIWCVCGCGLGSSFALEMTAKPVLEKLGVKFKLDHTTVSEVLALKPDAIITSSTFADAIKSSASPQEAEKVITIEKFTDSAEMEEKLSLFFNK